MRSDAVGFILLVVNLVSMVLNLHYGNAAIGMLNAVLAILIGTSLSIGRSR